MFSKNIKYPIVFGCDDAYSMPLATAMRSVVEANVSIWPCEFFVLTNNISEHNKRKVFRSLPGDSASIQWINVETQLFERFQPPSHISKIAYARILIPELLPDYFSRVLYLDADILVLDDLRPVWETDLSGSAVGAVLDGVDTQIKNKQPGLKNVPQVLNYFNSGVLIINTVNWKKFRISEKAINYLNLFPDTPFCDQDALNVACDGLWKKLDSRWNFVDYYEQKNFSQLAIEALPGIVHFATEAKPWDARFLNANAGFYDSFRERTLFARTASDKQQDALLRTRLRLKRVLKQWIGRN